jgi:N-acetylglutamate synthase-like GNAT family acetyltransferase
MDAKFSIRPTSEDDRSFIRDFIKEHWGGEEVIVHNETYLPADLPGFLCIQEGVPVGLITYHLQGNACEIVSLDSLERERGIGSALIESVAGVAREADCDNLWLVTTNDNLNALGFYQKRGFQLTAVIPGAVNESRKRKPGIPLIGENGIPITDEIVLTREIVS